MRRLRARSSLRRPTRRKTVIILLCSALTLAALAFAGHAYIFRESPRIARLERAAFAKHKMALLEDLRWLKTIDIFVAKKGIRNAEPELLKLIGGIQQDSTGSLSAQSEQASVFVKRQHDTLTPEERNYLKSVDTKWMQALKPYDHWQWASKLAAPKEGESVLEIPAPDIYALSTFAPLRLHQGLLMGDIESAVNDVRHPGACA